MRRIDFVTCLVILATCVATGSATTIQVGPTRTYTTVAAGYNAANSGDTIEIDSGTYYQGAGWVNIGKSNLTFRGVGPTRPLLDAGGSALSSKGIFVVSAGNLTVDNLEFANTWISNGSGANAAGIRFQASTLTVRNCYFHDNQDGILTDAGSTSDILIEYSEFNHNGESNPANTNGYGYTHNMYIGNIRKFTLQHCYSHDSNAGHVVKTRANTNFILYNLLTTETGTGSRELQLAQGGTCYVIGNVILQGPNTGNAEIMAYGGEGTNANPYLYIVNNTVINQRPNGAVFLAKENSTSSGAALLQNNIFLGYGNETLIGGASPSGVTQTTNWITTNAYLANIANHDYHLTAASVGAINAGTTPGTGYNSISLVPTYQYVHPYARETRPTNGTIDIGAYEYYVPPANTAPIANAGLDQTITLPTSQVTLSGSATDDGLPNPPAALTYTWSQVSGPATVNFANPNAAGTTASGLTVAGSYVLRLTVSDSILANDDTMTITVNPRPNTAPTVNAGPDITAVYENMPVSLHAAGTDADNDPLTYAWTQTAGANAVSPVGASTADYSFGTPVLAARSDGTMTFRVDVNDGHGGSANGSVNVQVYMAGDSNHDWFVNVGDLQALVAAWGSDNTGSWGNWDANADFNGDGFVNVGDLQLLVANWGRNL